MRKLEDGSLVYLLQANAELASKLTGKNLPKRIDTRVELADGFVAPVKILYPPHMVEGEQYPLLVYVYGGPGSQMVDDRSVHRVDRVLSFPPVVRIGTPPPPHTRAIALPLFWFSVERGGPLHYPLDCGRGGGTVLIPTRGQTLWYSRYIYVLCGSVCRRNRRLRLCVCLTVQIF